MHTNKSLSLILVLLFSVSLFSVECNAAEPPELTKLRVNYEAQLKNSGSVGEKQTLLKAYIQQLTSLENNLQSNMRGRSSVNDVRREIREANNRLASGTSADESVSTAESSSREEKKYKEPAELIALRDKYIAQKDGLTGLNGSSALLRDYLQGLTSLESNLRSNMQSRTSVNAVRNEIRNVRAELAGSKVVESGTVSVVPETQAIPEDEEPLIEMVTEPIPVETAPEPEPEVVVAEKTQSAQPEAEPAPEPIVKVPAPVVPLFIPNIVPVIAVAKPIAEKDEVEPVQMVAAKPAPKPVPVPVVPKPVAVQPILVEVAKPAPKPVVSQPAPVALAQPVLKPAAALQPVPVAVAESRPEPITPKPVAPKPIPFIAAESKPEPVAPKPVAAKPAPAEVAKPVALTPTPEVAPQPVFKPAAPKPIPLVAAESKPESVSPKPDAVKPAPVEVAKPTPIVKSTPIPAAKPVVSQSSSEKSGARTHVDETRGLAGSRSVRENHVYSFNLDNVGKKTTLTFYATGQKSIDTFGKIWLINQNNRPVNIGKWKDSDFDKSADKISSYNELNPITIDITKFVTKPGAYKIEFDWTDFGKEPLVIFRVEVKS